MCFPGTANGGVALDECAVPAPISAYGQTKLLGEQYVERFCRRHFIVRTAWLYSSYGKNFVKTMIRLGRTHDKITVVNDQLGNPTNAVDLAYHILKLAVSHDYGIYHCTGNGICSWYDFACASCKAFSNRVKYCLSINLPLQGFPIVYCLLLAAIAISSVKIIIFVFPFLFECVQALV